uniref:Uncharacterized protein n=1 Tax=Rhizophora mucronata TaxID=61149 RepID=A0A2P2Q166_RHIMU
MTTALMCWVKKIMLEFVRFQKEREQILGTSLV